MKIIDAGVLDDTVTAPTEYTARRLLLRLQRAIEATEDAIQQNRDARITPELERFTDDLKHAQTQLQEFLEKGVMSEDESRELTRLLMRIDRRIEDKLDMVVNERNDTTLRDVLREYARRTGKITLATLDISRQLGRVAGMMGTSFFRFLQRGFGVFNVGVNDITNSLGQQVIAGIAGPLAPLAGLVNVGDLLSDGFGMLQQGFGKTKEWLAARKERKEPEPPQPDFSPLEEELQKTRDAFRDELRQQTGENELAMQRLADRINEKLERGDGDIETELQRMEELSKAQLRQDQDYYADSLEEQYKSRNALIEGLDTISDNLPGGMKLSLPGKLGKWLVDKLAAPFLLLFGGLRGKTMGWGRFLTRLGVIATTLWSVKKAWDALHGDFSLFRALPESIQRAVSNVVGPSVEIMRQRWDVARQQWKAMSEDLHVAFAEIQQFFDDFPGKIGAMVDALQENASLLLQALQSHFARIQQSVEKWTGTITQWIKDRMENTALGRALSVVTRELEAISKRLGQLWESQTASDMSLGEWFKQTWRMRFGGQEKKPAPATSPEMTPKVAPRVQKHLRHYGPFLRMAETQYGVPAELLASMIEAESGGNPNAVSPKGARGLLQMMPETARELGVDPDKLFDPQTNIMAAGKYMQLLHKMALQQGYKGREAWLKAVEAYNAGPTRVFQRGFIPAETRVYRERVEKGLRIVPQQERIEPLSNQQEQQDSSGVPADRAMEQRKQQKPKRQPAPPPVSDASGYTRAPYSANETPMYHDDLGVLLINTGMLG